MTPEEHAKRWWGADDYPHREDFDALVEEFRQVRDEALEEAAETLKSGHLAGVWTNNYDEYVRARAAAMVRALKELSDGA